MKNNRNLFLDITKGILMILVIIGHFAFFEYESRTLTLIYSFHMPAFFIIAGILSHINEDSSIINVIKKRFRSTIIPYYLFYFISFVITNVNAYGDYNKSIKYMLNGIGNPDYSINLPLWFLTLYFVATTIYEILDIISIKFTNHKSNIKKFMINPKREFILIFFIFIFSYISFMYCRILKGPRLIYNFEIALLVLPFIYIGRLLKYLYLAYNKKIQKIFFKNENKKNLFYILNVLFFILLFFIWYSLSMKNLRLDLNARNIRLLHLTYINGILGTVLIMYICYLLQFIPIINKTLAFIGKISLYVLAFHVPGYLVAFLVFYEYLPTFITKRLEYFNPISIVVLTTIELLFSIFAYLIITNIKKNRD